MTGALQNALIAARHPRNTLSYARCFGRLPDYVTPRTYSEKMQWRKLFDRRPLLITLCDKFAVRGFARSRSSEVKLPDLYWYGDDPDAIPWKSLRPPFVVKPNNRSGAWLFIRTDADFDVGLIKQRCREWLNSGSYGKHFCEWAYTRSKPLLLIEQFLSDSAELTLPPDFKVDVFAGRARQILLQDRGKGKRGMYTPDWEPLQLDRWKGGVRTGGYREIFQPDVPCPRNLKGMIRIAEAIGRDIDYVRVDLYNFSGDIYLGEITAYPYSGRVTWMPKGTVFKRYPPRDFDYQLGELWTLPVTAN